MRSLVERGLRRRGHEVVACGDAETGLSAFREDAFSLVVLDWLLPGMDGLELCRWIRAAPDGDHPLVLVITVQDGPEHLSAVLDAGADDYLAKPFTSEVLDVRLAIAERRIVQAAEQRRAVAELARNQSLAAEAIARDELNRQQRMLLDLVGHELKTPLTSIAGYSELLLRRTHSASFLRQALEMIHEGCGRLSRIVSDILDLAEMEGGGITLVRSPIDLRQALPKWIADVDADRRVEVVFAPDLPEVLGDYSRLARAVGLLLRNALRFAPADRPPCVEATAQANSVAISVIDSGPGIPADELPRVFEAFYRTDHARKQALPGPGLGLALVRHIAALHGGEVHAESSLNKGSTFTLKIPAMHA